MGCSQQPEDSAKRPQTEQPLLKRRERRGTLRFRPGTHQKLPLLHRNSHFQANSPGRKRRVRSQGRTFRKGTPRRHKHNSDRIRPPGGLPGHESSHATSWVRPAAYVWTTRISPSNVWAPRLRSYTWIRSAWNGSGLWTPVSTVCTPTASAADRQGPLQVLPDHDRPGRECLPQLWRTPVV